MFKVFNKSSVINNLPIILLETYQPPPKPSKPVEEIISEEEEEEPMLVIGNRKVLYQEVTESMIAKMTPKEKEAYINMGKELYEDMYD